MIKKLIMSLIHKGYLFRFLKKILSKNQKIAHKVPNNLSISVNPRQLGTEEQGEN